MSAIPAASVSLKTMADGTLRMTFDIEPAQAKDAFSLFASPGTPVAIAALQVGYAAKSNEPAQKEPMGPLCRWIVLRCAESDFWMFLNAQFHQHRFDIQSPESASDAVKAVLNIASRKEIDSDSGAEYRFHELIRYPYQKWLVRRQG